MVKTYIESTYRWHWEEPSTLEELTYSYFITFARMDYYRLTELTYAVHFKKTW
jgi:hypothetical protein